MRAAMEEIGFEEIYARARSDPATVPWADMSPNAALVAWLAGQPAPGGTGGGGGGAETLVVGCGLGDDAEELARRGHRVTAFDISSTAIELCRERFPASSVNYQVADVFDLPPSWHRAFDLVVEIRTLQSLPPSTRAEAARTIAGTVAPGGRVWVRTAIREPDEPLASRPWPLTREELAAFSAGGLVQTELHEDPPATGGRFKTATAIYARPG